MASVTLATLATLVIGLALPACVGPRPPEGPSNALFRDIERQVSVSVAAGWEIDRYEVEELMPFSLASICRTPKPARIDALRWIDGQIEKLGGPVESAYAKNGESLDDLEPLLELSRIRLVLGEGIARAEVECPFWLRTENDFAGLELLDDRWVFSFGGGGKAILVNEDDDYDISGGGAGRLLLGHSFGQHWLFSLGAEVGALAAFPKDEDGVRNNFVIGAEAVVPLVARYRLTNAYVEVEAGPLGQAREDRDEPSYGIHLGASFGAQATRRLFVIPGVAFGLSLERIFANGLYPASTAIKAGFRVAIDLPL